MTTFSKLYAARHATGRRICEGLDPDLQQIPNCVPGDTPAERVYNFLVGIVDATHKYVLAYKPQIAYFEDGQLGPEGLVVLKRVIDYIRSVDPTIPIILDFKRGDIGRSNEAYVREAFDLYGADAATVHPYLGMEAMKPFLVRSDKTIIVLCRTSNPGAGEFQDVECVVYKHSLTGEVYSTLKEFMRENGVEPNENDFEKVLMPLYQFVAYRVAQKWNSRGNCAVVVGATYADQELKAVRSIVGDLLILIPGIGTQGGDLEASIRYGQDSQGWGVVLNNSSAILFAYSKLKKEDGSGLKYTPEQYKEAAAEAAEAMHRAVIEAWVKDGLNKRAAILLGHHFIYQSRKHGPNYVNYDPAFPDVVFTNEVCKMLARPFLENEVDVVVSPVIGGVALAALVGLFMSQQGRKVMVAWADKDDEGNFVFIRAGFREAVQGKRVLVVDDVMTNPNNRGSVFKLVRLVRNTDGYVVGVSLVCNRCRGTAEDLGVLRLEALMSVDFDSFEAADCPLCQQQVPIVTDVAHGREYEADHQEYLGGYVSLLD